MADQTIHDETAATSAATSDEILMWVAGSSVTRKITKANFMKMSASGNILTLQDYTLTLGGNSSINGTIAGSISGGGTFASGGFTLMLSGDGGTLALGGFTLTVPATGTAALLAEPQTFTGNKTFSGTTTYSNNHEINALVGVCTNPDSSIAQTILKANVASRKAVRVDIPATPTTEIMEWCVAGTQRANFNIRDTVTNFTLSSADLGTGVRGCTISIGRNTHSGDQAGGNLFMTTLGGTNNYMWIDNSNNLRIGTTAPINAQDTSGTVVGTQTSMAAAKDIDAVMPDWKASLRHVIEAVQGGALRSWKYKSGAYSGEHFPIGLVTDLAGRYGMDRSDDAPNGRSLNIPVAIGDLFAAVAMLAERVQELEGQQN